MKKGIVFALLVFLLVACTASQEETSSETLTYEESLSVVQETLPATTYFTNDYLPTGPIEPADCESITKVKVGMPWIFNDEPAPWYIVKAKEWDKAQCQDWELVAGGPGVDHLKTAAGGALDVAVTAGGALIPKMHASPTGADMVAVGTFLKASPYGWLGIDWDMPKSESHDDPTAVLEPEDFVGKTLGIQSDSHHLVHYIWEKYDLKGEPDIVKGGFSPDPLLTRKWDYYGAWIVNQPRLLEQQGYNNWVFFPFSDHGYKSYSDVSAVPRSTLQDDPKLVRRYLAALTQGMNFLLEQPEESAEITVKWAKQLGDTDLEKPQVLRRFELQEKLVRGDDDQHVLYMLESQWDNVVAILYQYGQIEFNSN